MKCSAFLFFLSLSIKGIGIISLKCINNYPILIHVFLGLVPEWQVYWGGNAQLQVSLNSLKCCNYTNDVMAKCQDGCDRERGQEWMHHNAGWLRQGPCHHLHQDPQEHQPPEPEEGLCLHWHHGQTSGPGGPGLPHILSVICNIKTHLKYVKSKSKYCCML